MAAMKEGKDGGTRKEDLEGRERGGKEERGRRYKVKEMGKYIHFKVREGRVGEEW